MQNGLNPSSLSPTLAFFFSLRVEKKSWCFIQSIASHRPAVYPSGASEEISQNSHHPPISFLHLKAFLIREGKTLSKYYESQASIQTAPFKGVTFFCTARDFFIWKKLLQVQKAGTTTELGRCRTTAEGQ